MKIRLHTSFMSFIKIIILQYLGFSFFKKNESMVQHFLRFHQPYFWLAMNGGLLCVEIHCVMWRKQTSNYKRTVGARPGQCGTREKTFYCCKKRNLEKWQGTARARFCSSEELVTSENSSWKPAPKLATQLSFWWGSPLSPTPQNHPSSSVSILFS